MTLSLPRHSLCGIYNVFRVFEIDWVPHYNKAHSCWSNPFLSLFVFQNVAKSFRGVLSRQIFDNRIKNAAPGCFSVRRNRFHRRFEHLWPRFDSPGRFRFSKFFRELKSGSQGTEFHQGTRQQAPTSFQNVPKSFRGSISRQIFDNRNKNAAPGCFSVCRNRFHRRFEHL